MAYFLLFKGNAGFISSTVGVIGIFKVIHSQLLITVIAIVMIMVLVIVIVTVARTHAADGTGNSSTDFSISLNAVPNTVHRNLEYELPASNYGPDKLLPESGTSFCSGPSNPYSTKPYAKDFVIPKPHTIPLTLSLDSKPM